MKSLADMTTDELERTAQLAFDSAQFFFRLAQEAYKACCASLEADLRHDVVVEQQYNMAASRFRKATARHKAIVELIHQREPPSETGIIYGRG